ncbi:MAG: hypothetical protein COA84_07605 [Robiginitomaculum sp.]|nr:MAG: hypothetical protein COA84_07605 [Robiginitomaculum sp.]
MNNNEGFKGAVSQAVAGAEPLAEDAAAAQMALFDEDRALPGPLTGANGQTENAPRGRGRPKGARNRSNEAMVKHLLAQYRHPLYGLFDLASTPIPELARALTPEGASVTREDLRWAAEMHRKCVVEAASYVQGKAPVAVEVTAKDWPSMAITLGMFGGQSGASGPQLGMDAEELKRLGISNTCEDEGE